MANRISALVSTFMLVALSLPACAGQSAQGKKIEESADGDPFAVATLGFQRINPDISKYVGDARAKCGAASRSPLMLNIYNQPFAFSDDNDTVAFDMDGDGVKENLGWALKNSNTAFLALDRNNNGAIDNGSELFSSLSPQPRSLCPNGYLALKTLDDDGDDVISASDTGFHRLLLWTDLNHNGMSEKSELVPVRLHLRSIDLGYVRSDRQDKAGNTLSLFGTAITKNHQKIFIVDVRFLEVFEKGD